MQTTPTAPELVGEPSVPSLSSLDLELGEVERLGANSSGTSAVSAERSLLGLDE